MCGSLNQGFDYLPSQKRFLQPHFELQVTNQKDLCETTLCAPEKVCADHEVTVSQG